MERDRLDAMVDMASMISTHTLTWSVTCDRNISKHIDKISTHTLTWSVTGLATLSVAKLVNFNSHAHVERDTCASITSV